MKQDIQKLYIYWGFIEAHKQIPQLTKDKGDLKKLLANLNKSNEYFENLSTYRKQLNSDNIKHLRAIIDSIDSEIRKIDLEIKRDKEFIRFMKNKTLEIVLEIPKRATPGRRSEVHSNAFIFELVKLHSEPESNLANSRKIQEKATIEVSNFLKDPDNAMYRVVDELNNEALEKRCRRHLEFCEKKNLSLNFLGKIANISKSK